MYVVRVPFPGGGMLTEMTPKALATALAEAAKAGKEYPQYMPVSGARAHKWVRDDFPHETPLYVGEDRYGRPCIRYAKDGI